jgi:xylitol oxidase
VDFAGMPVGLGLTGILTSLTLDLEPTYDMAQYVYEDLPRAQFAEHFQQVLATAYSISLFTDWRRPVFDQVWLKRRLDRADTPAPEPGWMGARPAAGPRHMIPGVDPVNCTEQLGVPGPWHERLPFFRLSFTPSSGEELQSEYLVPRESALEALEAIDRVRDAVTPALQMSEIRTIAADDLWMSPAHGRDSVGIHFTWIRDVDAVAPAVAAVEAVLEPFSPRPHWGKVFTTTPEAVRAEYARLADFSALIRRLDPHGKFTNGMTERYLSG